MTTNPTLYIPRLSQWIGVLFALLLAGGSVADTSSDEIEYLLNTVAQSDHQFVRNGERHAGPEGAEHLRRKYEYRRDDIHSAEDFIEQAASGSWLSGDPYQVELASGETLLTRDWLSDQLKIYRDRQETSPQAAKDGR